MTVSGIIVLWRMLCNISEVFSALRELYSNYLNVDRYHSWFAHERDSIFPQLIWLQALMSALQADRDPQGPLHCRSLSTMLISCYTKTEVAYMLQLVKSRAAAGHPLSCLLLDIKSKRTGNYEMREYDSEGVLHRILVDFVILRLTPIVGKHRKRLGVPELW